MIKITVHSFTSLCLFTACDLRLRKWEAKSPTPTSSRLRPQALARIVSHRAPKGKGTFAVVAHHICDHLNSDIRREAAQIDDVDGR